MFRKGGTENHNAANYTVRAERKVLIKVGGVGGLFGGKDG